MKPLVIGICFAAILVLFCLLLFRDSNLFKDIMGGFKELKARGAKGNVKRWLKKPMRRKITKHPIVEVYNRKKEKSSFEVKQVPFYFGTGKFCDLRIIDEDATEIHGVLTLERGEAGERFVFKNLSRDHNTDYLEQPSKEQPYWVNLRENVWWRRIFNKSDKVYLYNTTEEFYLGETKIVLYMPELERKVTQTDRMRISGGFTGEQSSEEVVKRSNSRRVYEENVRSEEQVDC